MNFDLKPNPDNYLDIIVPAFNNTDITARCIASLLLSVKKGQRIILVDNGSTDPGIFHVGRMLQALGHTFIRIHTNKGPYAAVNEGIKAGTSLFVSVVCNDVVVLPDTIANLVSSIRPELGICAVGACQPDVVGEWDFMSTINNAKACGLGQARLKKTQGYFTCFVALRSLFDEHAVGLFDENFGLTFGDTDWEERYRLAGLIYAQAEHAIVHHGHSVTRKRLGVKADFEANDRDHRLFLEKWADNEDVMRRHAYLHSEETHAHDVGVIWNKVGEM
jgi:GT2 family glycosyltransferase